MSEDVIGIPKVRATRKEKINKDPSHRFFKKAWRNPSFLVAFGFLCILLIVAVSAPLIVAYDPNDIDLPHKNEGFSSAHPLGTDYLGRDLMSRVIWGAQTSLIIAFVTVGCAFIAGTLVGCIAAYYGGVVDEILSRGIDLFLAFPGIIFSLALLGLIGPGILNMILALTLSQWATFARLMRGNVLSITNLEYIQSAKTGGLPTGRIILKHLIPNAIMPVLILATLDIGSVILSTAGLSFLGLGIPPGIPEWGSMVGAGKEYLRTAPLNVIVPGLAITLVVMIFNVLGEGLRDIFDVREEQVIPV